MNEYPKYILDEAERRLRDASNFERMTGGVLGSCTRAVANLLIESGFKPPVDPLLRDVWQISEASSNADSFQRRLAEAGLTVTVTKTGAA